MKTSIKTSTAVALTFFSAIAFAHPCDGKISDKEIEHHLDVVGQDLLTRAAKVVAGEYDPVVSWEWDGKCSAPASTGAIHNYLLNSKEGKTRLANWPQTRKKMRAEQAAAAKVASEKREEDAALNGLNDASKIIAACHAGSLTGLKCVSAKAKVRMYCQKLPSHEACK